MIIPTDYWASDDCVVAYHTSLSRTGGLYAGAREGSVASTDSPLPPRGGLQLPHAGASCSSVRSEVITAAPHVHTRTAGERDLLPEPGDARS